MGLISRVSSRTYRSQTMNKLFILLALCTAVVFSAEQLKIGKLKKVACDRKSKAGDRLYMHYRGTLKDGGKEFDSSYKRNQLFDFVLGGGQVIKGWDQGLQNMCPGEKRRLTIPAHLGYGDRGAGADIPGGATLVFEVELAKIQAKNGEEYEEVKEEGKEEL